MARSGPRRSGSRAPTRRMPSVTSPNTRNTRLTSSSPMSSAYNGTNALNPTRPQIPRKRIAPGTNAARGKKRLRVADGSAGRTSGHRRLSSAASTKRQVAASHTAVVAARVEHQLAEDGPERGARVERHREVRHPLTPSRLRGEVGDRRRDADPERSLPDALDHARSDEQRDAVDREVHGRRERGDQRAAQDQDPAARTVADPAGDRTERHRAEPEGAERDPDRDVTPAERAFDEAREHRHDHAERGEVEETGADQREERRREQAFFARGGHARWSL